MVQVHPHCHTEKILYDRCKNRHFTKAPENGDEIKVLPSMLLQEALKHSFDLLFRSKQVKRSKGEFWVKRSIGFHCPLHQKGVQVHPKGVCLGLKV